MVITDKQARSAQRSSDPAIFPRVHRRLTTHKTALVSEYPTYGSEESCSAIMLAWPLKYSGHASGSISIGNARPDSGKPADAVL